jgi:hypothetical protein
MWQWLYYYKLSPYCISAARSSTVDWSVDVLACSTTDIYTLSSFQQVHAAGTRE